MSDARKNSIFVLDDGETYAGEGLELFVTDAELERIQEGEKIYNVIPDWDDPKRDHPSGCPGVPALTQNSVFEYTLNNEHTDNRVWVRINEPYGVLNRQLDVGLLVNGDGVSIDVYEAGQEDDALLSVYTLWGDIGERSE